LEAVKPLVGASGTESTPGCCSEYQNSVETVLLLQAQQSVQAENSASIIDLCVVLKWNEWLIFSKWHISFMMHDYNRGRLKPAVSG
jgi:hypothetical protein